MSDVSLMFDVRRRDADAVVRRMRGFVRALAEPYFVAGGDHDDTLQAARWGLAKAVRDWDTSKAPGGGLVEQNAFLGFARLCVQREVITAVKTSTRAKHRVLNEATRLDKPLVANDGSEVSLHEMLFREMDEPPRVVIALEDARRALQCITELTPLEREVVRRCLVLGERYEAVAASTGRNVKTVDNALQRARRKLREVPEPPIRPGRAVPAPPPDLEFDFRVYYLCRTIHKTRPEAERTALELRWGKVMECVPRRLLDGVEQAPQGRPRADGRRGVPVWRLVIRRLAPLAVAA